MISEEKVEWAKEALRVRAGELGRIPKKDDFDEVSLSRIKAFLGPWPRALETAGLKEVTKIKPPRSKRKVAKAKAQRTAALKKLAQKQNKQEK